MKDTFTLGRGEGGIEIHALGGGWGYGDSGAASGGILFGTLTRHDLATVNDPESDVGGVGGSSHGVPAAVATRAEEHFRLTADALAAKITPKSKVLMLNFPCNPTGATQTREELEKIAQLCVKHDLIVLTDEIYSEMTYDGA